MSALAATMRAAATDAYSRKAAFWSQAAVMMANDLGWVAFWLLFFNRVGQVRQWDASMVMLLLAVLTTSVGIVFGLLSNARRIPLLVAEGALDETLALPVAPLPHLLLRRIDAVNVGDIFFGLCLFAFAGQPSLSRTAVFVVGVAASVVLVTGFLLATGSLVFFGGGGQPGYLAEHAMLLMAAYPADVFSGFTRIVTYTAVPAAFVSAVPARLVADFSASMALALAVSALTFGAAGWITFHLGLRRYTSGSTWSRR